MKIESRMQDMTQEVRVSELTSNTANRQRSVTSGSSGASTRKPTFSKAGESKGKGQEGVTSPPDPIDVHVAIEKLNKIAEAQKKDVSFSVDKDSEATVIKVFKSQTGELIKQFPPEEVLAMKARIRNYTGWFFDNKY
ncbi:flagellar protein FlaG [bacterium]|nr:flagellar protein FlaG [bacterium]